MPALISGTQALGEPRYPSLKGIMAARNKEIATLSLADLGIDPATVGTAGATTKVVVTRAPPPPRAATRVVREAPDEAARQVVGVPRRAEAHLMAGHLGRRRGRPPTARSTKLATEVAHAGARAGRGERRSGRSRAWSIGADPAAAAAELAAVRAARPGRRRSRRRRITPAGTIVAQRLAALVGEHEPDVVLSAPGPTAATSPGRCRR